MMSMTAHVTVQVQEPIWLLVLGLVLVLVLVLVPALEQPTIAVRGRQSHQQLSARAIPTQGPCLSSPTNEQWSGVRSKGKAVANS